MMINSTTMEWVVQTETERSGSCEEALDWAGPGAGHGSFPERLPVPFTGGTLSPTGEIGGG